MNKKILIIGGAIILLLVVAALLLGNSRGGVTNVVPTPLPTLAPPGPTGIFPQPTNAVFSFAKTPALPASLPSYSYQPTPLSSIESIAAKAAPSLGLSATPSALTRGGSYTKTWSRGAEASLVITQTGTSITITYHQIKSAVPSGTYAPDVAVQQFLLALVPSSSGLSVRAAGTSTGPFDGLLVIDTPPPKSFTGYLYSYITGGLPVLDADLSLVPISVIVDNGGIVRSASIVPPPGALTSGAAINLISPEQILASLSAGRGTLLDTHSPQAPEQGVVPSFAQFIISDIKIVYAPNNSQLLPAFYLTGSGTTTQGQRQDATIFLWAYPEGSL